MIKLNLGCGYQIKEGYLNVDKFGNPDFFWDLENFPWPWEDNSVEEVILHHVLEHLGQSTGTYLKIIQELYRVCTHEAVIDIRVPHHRSDNFIIDPTHVRIITAEGLSLFSRKANLYWKEIGAATTTLGLYLNVDFEIRSTVYVLSGVWNQKWIDRQISQDDLNYAIKTYNNVVDELHIKLAVIKDYN